MRRRGSCSCFPVFLFGLLLAVGVVVFIGWDSGIVPSLSQRETPWPEDLMLVNRTNWTSLEISDPENIDPMGGVNRITIHHDGLPPLPMQTENQIKRRIVAIRNTHTEKYADIGYHYIIDPLGRIWEGRPIEYKGAHVKGKNDHNIGILFLGNTYRDKPTEKALDGLYAFVRYLRRRYNVSEKSIHTHGELGATDCPGKYLQIEIDKARKNGEFKVSDSPQIQIDWERKWEICKEQYELGMKKYREVKKQLEKNSAP